VDRDHQTVKFAADRMLGKLAKWLRIMGQDVIYGPHLTGYGLIHAARKENRLILTRDGRLKQMQPPDFIFIESDRYREQLRQVVKACSLEPLAQAFSRCLECNAMLEPRAKDAVKELVPPYVFSTQERFFACPQCRRIFWPATHHERMAEELKRLAQGN
jgi:uncharacterized protein with PIN domain